MRASPQAFSSMKKILYEVVVSYEDISEEISTMTQTVLRFAMSVSKRSQYELKHKTLNYIKTNNQECKRTPYRQIRLISYQKAHAHTHTHTYTYIYTQKESKMRSLSYLCFFYDNEMTVERKWRPLCKMFLLWKRSSNSTWVSDEISKISQIVLNCFS